MSKFTNGYYVVLPIVPNDPPKPDRLARVSARGELISSRRKFKVMSYSPERDEYEIAFDDEQRAHAVTQPMHTVAANNLEGSARWSS